MGFYLDKSSLLNPSSCHPRFLFSLYVCDFPSLCPVGSWPMAHRDAGWSHPWSPQEQAPMDARPWTLGESAESEAAHISIIVTLVSWG
jgi:hypothetical protein